MDEIDLLTGSGELNRARWTGENEVRTLVSKSVIGE
jgi:hypothetical protein